MKFWIFFSRSQALETWFLPQWGFFFLINFFIADSSSVSHDQDYKLNFFVFFIWKVHYYLEKLSKHLFMIFGGHFLYIDNWKTKICLFWVSKLTDHFLFKNEENRVVTFPPKLRKFPKKIYLLVRYNTKVILAMPSLVIFIVSFHVPHIFL